MEMVIQRKPNRVSNMVEEGTLNLIASAHIAASGMCQMVHIDDATINRNDMINSKVYRAIPSAHIQTNALKLIGQHFTVQTIMTQSILL